MSQITLQPVGLVDAEKRYWGQKISTSSMERFKDLSRAIPPDFQNYLYMMGGSKYFPSGYRSYNVPAAAKVLFANYKALQDMGEKIDKSVLPAYGRLRERFHSYATEAHGHYTEVLSLLDIIMADILGNSPSKFADCQNLRVIVEPRTDLSFRMKDNASGIITDLLRVNSVLKACIKNINQSVADLKIFVVFTPEEQRQVDKMNITGFAEKYVLSKLGFEPLASLTTSRVQDAINDIAPAITEMQEELGRWEAINSDLLAIEDLINEEETTIIEIIATLDNEQILERWMELGDIVCCEENPQNDENPDNEE
ncbi:hypothetical protein BCON_1060g00010 [Botryotinia convoluta]|uniref:Uncharacterized protein n=1 Tax=Botryotinia convoluta TaxID=54673 RepID=A0A4Z1HEZ7_9HELO|nr:hypothetical protein BCON_1060g00010 [Botryotinia convoluta]